MIRRGAGCDICTEPVDVRGYYVNCIISPVGLKLDVIPASQCRNPEFYEHHFCTKGHLIQWLSDKALAVRAA
jgi:hypothetical protein